MSAATSVADVLARYRPGSAHEAGEVDRVRQLVEAGVDPWDRTMPLHLTASAFVVHPPSGRVLLRWHRRQQAWIQVGGHADPGETDAAAIARREAAEESGLVDLAEWSDPSLLHLVIVSVPADEAEPAHEHADLRFLLTTDDPAAAVPEHDDAPLRWLSFADAMAETEEENVRESLRRVLDRLRLADQLEE